MHLAHKPFIHKPFHGQRNRIETVSQANHGQYTGALHGVVHPGGLRGVQCHGLFAQYMQPRCGAVLSYRGVQIVGRHNVHRVNYVSLSKHVAIIGEELHIVESALISQSVCFSQPRRAES